MRLATCSYQGDVHTGVVIDDSIVVPSIIVDWPQEFNSVWAILQAGPVVWERLAQAVSAIPANLRLPLNEVELKAPIPRPAKNIMCLGLNYEEHAKESFEARGRRAEIPQYPVVFTKAVTSVNGPFADIPYYEAVCSQLDWEVELGVVIGRGGRNIPVEDALQHVFGYTVINDLSARDLQFRHKQYFLGKSLDGACPMGPWIVSVDEIPDPQNLDLYCWVNGELKQSSNTRYQIFTVAQIISTLSQSMTLEPGDIIATGTPSGVGFARTPPEFLQPGDIVECEIQGIGKIRNRLESAS
jgi:2-keto-4-pentenoate hydratase/2-oxohepta-3-ene-1,7-dioic acid hydratase in catechol pathway